MLGNAGSRLVVPERLQRDKTAGNWKRGQKVHFFLRECWRAFYKMLTLLRAEGTFGGEVESLAFRDDGVTGRWSLYTFVKCWGDFTPQQSAAFAVWASLVALIRQCALPWRERPLQRGRNGCYLKMVAYSATRCRSRRRRIGFEPKCCT